MLFTKPCCPKLANALPQGETRMFDLVGEPQSVLIFATSYSARFRHPFRQKTLTPPARRFMFGRSWF